VLGALHVVQNSVSDDYVLRDDVHHSPAIAGIGRVSIRVSGQACGRVGVHSSSLPCGMLCCLVSVHRHSQNHAHPRISQTHAIQPHSRANIKTHTILPSIPCGVQYSTPPKARVVQRVASRTNLATPACRRVSECSISPRYCGPIRLPLVLLFSSAGQGRGIALQPWRDCPVGSGSDKCGRGDIWGTP